MSIVERMSLCSEYLPCHCRAPKKWARADKAEVGQGAWQGLGWKAGFLPTKMFIWTRFHPSGQLFPSVMSILLVDACSNACIGIRLSSSELPNCLTNIGRIVWSIRHWVAVWKMHEADEALRFATAADRLNPRSHRTGERKNWSAGPRFVTTETLLSYSSSLRVLYRLPNGYSYGKRNQPNRFLLCHFVDVKTFQRAPKISWRCQCSWLRMGFVWLVAPRRLNCTKYHYLKFVERQKVV